MVEGIIYRYRTGITWRDLPEMFGPWQTVWKWHRRMAGDGSWDKILSALTAHADRIGAVDSTVARPHQHATNITRTTGGLAKLHGSEARAA